MNPVVHPRLAQPEQFAQDDLQGVGLQVDQQEQEFLLGGVENSLAAAAEEPPPGATAQGLIGVEQAFVTLGKRREEEVELPKGKPRESEEPPPVFSKLGVRHHQAVVSLLLIRSIKQAVGLNKPQPTRSKSPGSRWRNRTRLAVEQLEARDVPAITFSVNTLGDKGDANLNDNLALDEDGKTSLRAAIEQGNHLNQTQTAVTINFLFPAEGGDGGVGGEGGPPPPPPGKTITLTSALDDLDNNFTILGLGVSTLTVQRSTAAGTPKFRLFKIAPGKTVNISGLKMANGFVDAENDNNGGGIYNAGTLLNPA